MSASLPRSPGHRRPRAIGVLLAATLALGPAALHGSVAELESLQRENGNLLFQYGFEGGDDSTRLADQSGNAYGLQRTVGADGGDPGDISFVAGFDGGQAFRPSYDLTNRRIGAALNTVSNNLPLGADITVEAVVRMDDFVLPSGGSGGYLLSARPAGGRAYFFRQLGEPNDRVTSTFGDDYDDAPAVLDYTPGDWYYLALTASYNSGSNLTTVTWYGANLSVPESSLNLLASDSTSFTGGWPGTSQVGIGCFLNGSQEYLEGEIDSAALTNELLPQATLQDRLDALISGIPPIANGDSIEVGVGGALAFDPLGNDDGPYDPASLQVVSGPSAGSADFDPARGVLVYKHAGGPAGADSFRYRIDNTAGTLSAEADVDVTVSGAVRLANTTVDVPADPPTTPPGELVLEDALPGLTFPHAVTLASVPGSPNALLVGTVKSEIWYIPDTTAASPEKFLVLDLDDLTNYTNGRSIYSVECFPDFATSGHIIVNYQGDKTRLPVPNSALPGLDKNGSPDTSITCDLRISRFTLSPAHVTAAMDGLSPAENDAVLATEWPYLNLAEQGTYHTIGDAKFGADGYLYVSFGDEGGGQESQHRNSQTITKDQYCSLIRIDVDPASTHPKPNPHYAIAVGPLNGSHSPNTPFSDPATQEPNFRVPADNPFVHTSKGGSWNGDFNGVDLGPADLDQLDEVRDEVWVHGFRSPFKFQLEWDETEEEVVAWVGDIGRHDWEEVNVVRGGENTGWAYYEGDSFNPPIGHTPDAPAGSTQHHQPLHAYDHSDGNGSVTGGFIYHGTALSQLTGRYVFGDFNSGRIWSMSQDGSEKVELTDLRLSSERIVDFEYDAASGDIFVLENNTWSGGAEPRVMRITEQAIEQVEDYPQTLSELGIFADLADLSPNTGVVPYQPNLKFWSDGADKSRWFVIKNLVDTIGYSAEGNWTFPEGMVWVKHFDFDLDRSNPGTDVRRLETRLLVMGDGDSYGVSYRWNEAGTEATLVPTEGEDFAIDYLDTGGNPASLDWHIPARSECLTCHTPSGGHALSMNTRQFNLDATIHGNSDNLLTLLSGGGYLDGFADDPASLPRHYRPDETAVDLEARVRSYIDVNCAYCHQDGGNAPPSWDGRAELDLAQTNMLYGSPVGEGAPNLTDHLIRPGDKDHSAIWNRANARDAIGDGTYNGYSQMPPLASNVVDSEGTALLAQWIDHHANLAPAPADGSLGGTTVSENALVGFILGASDAEDPDVREGVSDQSQLSYAIVAGNDHGLFSIDPASGEIALTGWIDYERQPQHVLTVEVSDNFAPNPGVLSRTVVVDLVDETSPDLSEDLDGNGIFDSWEASFGYPMGDPANDDDRDGVPLFFEFLSGGSPAVADHASGLGFQLVGSDPTSDFGIAWNVRNGFLLGSDYDVAQSGTLGSWTTLVPEVDYEVVSVTPVTSGVSRVVIRYLTDSDRAFLRLAKPESP